MKKEIMKKTFMSLAIFVFCFSISAISMAWHLMPYHIKNGNTVPYYVDTKISSAGVYSITVADNQWNGISNRKVYLSQQSTRTNISDFTQDSKMEIFPKDMGTTGAILGKTRALSVYNGLLVEADIALNIAFPLANDPVAPTSYSVKCITTHEFGHLIGLDHSELDWDHATMSPLLDPGPESYNLKQDDITGYNSIAW